MEKYFVIYKEKNNKFKFIKDHTDFVLKGSTKEELLQKINEINSNDKAAYNCELITDEKIIEVCNYYNKPLEEKVKESVEEYLRSAISNIESAIDEL